ncbi:hypothetical protein GYMLUDRAFT_763565 [Collybiopsis luxurians FD-317 M1]|uniref:Unplaced genomic scaffold GYMLUscaffold_44, whole genome shotgun sequence n=1 Tax=Collybiopsis luxurians FD-317 M1 TaxID=944289 RepID=A0A0D0B1Y0_9AGAR|nr:hypothetical protein GYMLUDRAFT_763565 [Collybiopsis luxurians FD-317 M1]
MTIAIAGRVWYISRVTRKETSYELRLDAAHWYKRTLAIIIESGMIHLTYLVVQAVLFSRGIRPNYSCLASILFGIAPTLIAVRVGLRSPVEDQSLHLTAVAPPGPPTMSTQLDLSPTLFAEDIL